jgi:hypothetical protein
MIHVNSTESSDTKWGILIKRVMLRFRLRLVHSVEYILETGLKLNLLVSKMIHKPKYHEQKMITPHYLNITKSMFSAIETAKNTIGNNPYPLWKVVIYLYFVRQTERVSGQYVELGVGKGFMTCAALAYQSGASNREFLLFDKFDSYIVDENTGAVNKDKVNLHYGQNLEEVEDNLKQFKKDLVFVQGYLPESINLNIIDKISFLHIDLNSAYPETASLKLLWTKLSPGGIVILDDYAYEGRQAQFTAMNQLADELKFDILSLPTGQGLIIK